MFPNTLPLYTGTYSATPVPAHASEGDAFRISDDNQRGEFQLVLDGGTRIKVTIQHSVQNGKTPNVTVDRHTIRLEKTKVDSESGVEDVASASITLAQPRRSFTKAEMMGLINGLLNIYIDPSASSDQIAMGDNSAWPNLSLDALLSGAI